MSLESRPTGDHSTHGVASPTRALVLATISFALSFAAWGLVGGLASVFAALYSLTASQTALLVAVPVLLGSLARLPMGMLTDRFGGRLVFTALLLFSALAAFLLPLTGTYGSLLVAAFLIGMPDCRSRSEPPSCRAGPRPAARAPRSGCTWMRGYADQFLAILHAATVIVTLLWLPFGKLFHVFQRPAQLGVGFYKDAGAAKGSGPFYFPDGRARFNVADYRAPVDDASDEYPVYLTTGRVVSQFLSGTQTRRIGPLVKQYAEPRIEMHPRLAAKLGIADGDWTTAETRRGTITLKAQVVTTIRPDTIFIPYHWAGPKSANQLTVAAQDPISKIPQ